MDIDLAAANAFVTTTARVLERRLLGVLLFGDDPAGVVAAVAAHQNPDGGFGHALEPDKRVPDSQPLDVEIAFERLAMVGAPAPDLTMPALGWLASVAGDGLLLPVLLPSAAKHPRAAHWTPAEYPPGLNPTAAIVAHAHALELDHEWVQDATTACLTEVEAGRLPDDAHGLLCLAKLASAVGHEQTATTIGDAVRDALPDAAFYRPSADDDSYGLTPLDFVPAPHDAHAAWFDDDVIAGHLDALASEQADDGGWPVAWDPPGDNARNEWRGIRTVLALRTLQAHDRLG